MDTPEVGQQGTLALLNGSKIICAYASSVPGWLTFAPDGTSSDGIFTIHVMNTVSFEQGGQVGVTRKGLSFMTVGLVDFKSDKERAAASARKTKKAVKKQNKLIKKQTKAMRAQNDLDL